MDEHFFKQVIAELIKSQEDAFGILTTALCKQVDPAQLTVDLQIAIAGAKSLQSTPDLAIRFATAAMAAAQAQKTLQARPASEGPHPTRE